MVFIKKYCSIRANSILESVIALSIISVCLYVAIMVYSSVFSPRTSPKFYGTHNKLNELFFLYQIQNDSVMTIDNDNLKVEEEWINANLKQVIIKYRDSSKIEFEKSYFVQQNNE